MTEFERQIWAAAFAKKCIDESDFYWKHKGDRNSFSAFHCAEMADVVVESFRGLKNDPDYEYLLMGQENED